MIASWLVQEFWNCTHIQKIERKKWKQNHQNIFRTSGGPVYARLLSRINRANISVSEREGRKSWKLGLEFSLSYKLALGQMVVFYRKAKNRFVCTVVHDNIFDAQIYYYCKQVVVSTLFWKQFKKFHNFFFFEYCFSSTAKN